MSKLFPFLLIIIIVTIFGCNNSNQKSHIAAGVNADSISIYTNLLNEDSLSPGLWASRAELYLKKGNINSSLRDLQTALKLAPDNPKLYILLSDIYLVLGQTDNSIASLKKSIKLKPDSEIPYLKLSETYLLLNEPGTAIRYADEAININRQNPESYYVKAMGLMDNNDTSAAIINLGISANLDSNNYMANMQLGSIYTAMEDSLSITYFYKALKIKPNDERSLYYIGMYYQEHNEFEKAITKFNKITELYPDNKRAFYNMGYIYLVEMGDFENAKIKFKKAIAINPRYVEAVYNLGRTYEAMRDYQAARKQYKKALELLPNYPLAIKGMNRLDDLLIRNN